MNFSFPPHQILRVGKCTLVIYQWDSLGNETSPKVWENVELFDENDKKLWTINGMEKNPYWSKKDTFVHAQLKSQKIALISFGGSRFQVDIHSGEAKYERFVK